MSKQKKRPAEPEFSQLLLERPEILAQTRLLADRLQRTTLELWQTVQELLSTSASTTREVFSTAARNLFHRLQALQTTLELQNYQLCQAQREVVESRDRYCDLYDFAPVGYVALDPAGRILESNITAASMLGLDSKELALGKSFSSFVAGGSQRKCALHLQAVFSTGARQVCELNVKKARGSLLAIRLESILVERSPAAPHCRTALIDETDGRAARHELQRLARRLEQRVRRRTADLRRTTDELANQSAQQRSTEQHRLLLANAISHLREGVLISEGQDWAEARIVFVNEAICRMTGYNANELIGQPQRVLDAGVPTATLDRLRDEVSAGNSCQAELVISRKDGTRFDDSISITPMKGALGQLTNFISVHRDVTERKRAELSLDQYRKDLRTVSSELLLIAERERQRLAQSLHDGLGQAIFRARMQLDQIGQADATREIAAILDEARKIVNTLTFELSPPVLRQLGFRPAVKWLARDIKQRYGLSVDIDDHRQPIPMEEPIAIVLFQSVRELLINAAKHAKTDQARVTIKAPRSNFVEVTVQDQGKGFTLPSQCRLVEAGHFGLFSIRERLEYLNGTVRIQSSPRRGTTVVLTAPLAIKHATAKTNS